MIDKHNEYIEQLSSEIERLSQLIEELRRTTSRLSWQRRQFIELDDKRRPARTPLGHLYRRFARAIAFWLLR
jgi:predicted RNase H-like nuclease (RuvC/YqgF family)